MKLSKFIFAILFLSSIIAFSQQTQVSGTVTDEVGMSIPGVSVVVEGTKVGTLTDLDGKYSLNTEIGKKLQFSYVGMKTITKVVEGKQLDVQMAQDVMGLDEVIITGTSGNTTKKQLGSAITSIKAESIGESKSFVSIDEALQGQVAGAKINRNSGDPSGGVSVTLRGNNSITGSSEPLYIVDGVVINNNSGSLINLGGNTQNRLVDLDADGIERIEILKGAAAAAIYGSRASNGVVQIFTKKGKIGAPKISLSSSINFNEVRKTLPYNSVNFKWNSTSITDLTQTPVTRYNYQDYIFTKSQGFENDLGISGGNEKTTYSVSLSQFKNGGIIRNTDFARNSLRLRLDEKLFKSLSLSVGSYLSKSLSHDMPNGDGSTTVFGPLTGLIFLNNATDANANSFGIYPNFGGFGNPYETIDRVNISQNYLRNISDIQLKYSPFEGFNVNYVLGMDYSAGDGLMYIPLGFNANIDGESHKITNKSILYNSDINASYQYKLGENIALTTGVGYSYQYDEYNKFGMINSIVSPVESVIVVNPASVTSGADYRGQRAIWGGYIQQNIGYKEKLFLSFSGRMDGASTFGIEERQQFYPKASVSYSISEEDFWQENMSFINYFKIRAAWGQAGNLSALSPYLINSNYNSTIYGTLVGNYPSSLLGNDHLKPERQTEAEIGFDMNILKDRVGIEFSYYDKKVTDLLLLQNLPPSTGYTQKYDNIGGLTNKGLEILLKVRPVVGEFEWDITSIFSKNKNRLTNVVGGKVSIGAFGFSVAQTDQALGAFYGSFIARDANGNPVLTPTGFLQFAKGHYVNETLSDGSVIPVAVQDFDPITGQPTGIKLNKIIGDPNPDFTASLSNHFKYKNIGLGFQLDMSYGNDIMSWDKRISDRFEGGQAFGQELQGIIPKGSSAAKYLIFETFIEDGSFVKLREVYMSYNLKIEKSFLENVKFTLSGNNLISWDNYFGFDPEVNTGGQTNGVSGHVMASVPIPRTYKFGVVFNF